LWGLEGGSVTGWRLLVLALTTCVCASCSGATTRCAGCWGPCHRRCARCRWITAPPVSCCLPCPRPATRVPHA
jgi:hypothetical protein